MSIENSDRKNIYSANGSTVYWTYTFSVFESSDLSLYVTDSSGTTTEISSSLYTIDTTNMRIKYPKTGSALASGNTVTVARNTALTQEISLRTQEFNPKSMERGLDKLTMIVQEQGETLSRALVTDITTTGGNFSMAAPEANKVIGWDSAGENMINYDNPAVSEAAAAASAIEAAAYAEQAADSAIEAGTVVDYEGPTAPTATKALMKWHDTTNYILKMRNLADNGWIEIMDTTTGNTLTDPLGTIKEFYGTTLPTRHLWVNGCTIGDADSGAVGRANADTIDLYKVLWESANVTGSQIQLYNSAGVATTKGTDATSDFAAHKRLSLPDKRGRAAIGQDNMGGISANVVTNTLADVLGGCAGEEKHILTIDEIPSHSHNIYLHNVTGSGTGGGGNFVGSIIPAGTSSTGGSLSHNNMQPWVACNFIMRY